MAKIFGVLVIVLGVWVGMEIYTKGMHDAFGGALARFEEPLQTDTSTPYDDDADSAADDEAPTGRDSHLTSEKRGSLAQRIGGKVRADIKAGEKRDDPDAAEDEDDN
jgi:hypothetical protein